MWCTLMKFIQLQRARPLLYIPPVQIISPGGSKIIYSDFTDAVQWSVLLKGLLIHQVPGIGTGNSGSLPHNIVCLFTLPHVRCPC